MRHGFTIVFCAAVLGGCAGVPSTRMMGAAPAPGCHAAGATGVLGQRPDEHVVEEALRGAGALRSRIIQPGSVATTDVDPMRLNLELDGEGRIHRMVCG